jgi:hypothetical protein
MNILSKTLTQNTNELGVVTHAFNCCEVSFYGLCYCVASSVYTGSSSSADFAVAPALPALASSSGLGGDGTKYWIRWQVAIRQGRTGQSFTTSKA